MKTASTEGVYLGKFQAHGQVDISAISPNILLFRATGLFNQELICALKQIDISLMRSVVEHGKGIWSEIILFEVSCMATEGLFTELNKHIAELKHQNLIPIPQSCAFVIADGVEGKLLMHQKYINCYLE